MKAVIAILSFLIVAPIWYYLLYQILVRVNASELMFFLYWVYAPAAIISGSIRELLNGKAKS